MKLIIQIPCLNEEQTLPLVFATMPKKIAGIDVIETLVVDDGSTDRTVEVAQKLGVTHIVRHAGNRGLSKSFQHGVEYALEHGADIVVNTDGDNQYPQERIADLVQPIVEERADIVIADRQTHTIEHFSLYKKLLQRFGSTIVNLAAGTELPDAASGFRAYSRQALLELNLITTFSYCMETIIQAGNKHLTIVSIPIETNAKTRESRLFRSSWEHIRKSAAAILRAYLMYRPSVVFGSLAMVLIAGGVVPFARFLSLEVVDHSGRGHLQSLIIGIVLLMAGFLCLVLNVIAELIRINRSLIEQDLELSKKIRYTQAK